MCEILCAVMRVPQVFLSIRMMQGFENKGHFKGKHSTAISVVVQYMELFGANVIRQFLHATLV